MLISADYKIESLLHESTNSRVYRAHRLTDQLPVILKVLQGEYLTPERQARLKAEYQLMQSLHSPGIVRAYQMKVTPHLWMIEEEDFGGSALSLLDLAGTISVDNFLSLAIQIAGILEYIHQHKIIHKDINPSNILFNPVSGEVKLTDFGMATRLSREFTSFRSAEAVEGTLPYIAPEQTGRMNRAIDYRADFYSLGATFYELLIGHPPFTGNDVLELLHAHLALPAGDPHLLRPEVPPALAAIVLKLLAKHPEERYQSVTGLLSDLERCQSAWSETGQIPLFPIGEQDRAERLQLPQRLYGRDHERGLLLEALAAVSGGPALLVLVAGESGVGKTTLVQEISTPLTRQRGLYGSGKYDLLQRDVPYSGLLQALNGVLRQILAEQETVFTAWQTRIHESLGSLGQIMMDLLPDLALLIGPQRPAAAVGPTEVQQRLLLAFQRLVGAISQPAQPLVLFLDDLQWADSASLSLIERLLTHTRPSGLLIIGAYRPSEVGVEHVLRRFQSNLQEAGIKPVHLGLTPFTIETIQAVLQDTLLAAEEELGPLSQVLQRKTAGNPFFLQEFLRGLEAEGLIWLSQTGKKWAWDLAAIEQHPSTTNVVDLLVGQLQQLHSETQMVMGWASCLGHTFDLALLEQMMGVPVSTITTHMEPAVAQGLVMPLSQHRWDADVHGSHQADAGNQPYQFNHDRVQQAAYSMLDADQAAAMHYQIGQALLGRAPANEREQQLFTITDHLNKGASLLTQQAERDELAALNLQTGRRAKASAAFGSAYAYFRNGLYLLGPTAWHATYPLALALTEEAAEMAYLIGEHAQTQALTGTILAHARHILDRIPAYEIQMNADHAQQAYIQQLELAKVALHELGVTLPQRITKAHVVAGLLRTWWKMRRRSPLTLLRQPMMNDPQAQAILRILGKVINAAYYTDPLFFPIASFEMIRLTMRKGMGIGAIPGYIIYSLLVSTGLGDIQGGYEISEFLLEADNRFGTAQSRAAVSGAYVMRHFKEHLTETLTPLWAGYQAGLEIGEFFGAASALYLYIYHYYFTGQDLPAVARKLSEIIPLAEQLLQAGTLQVIHILRQTCENLLGLSSNPTRFADLEYGEEHLFRTWREAESSTHLFILSVMKATLCYLFEEIEEAYGLVCQARQYAASIQGQAVHTSYVWYESLVCLARYPALSLKEQREVRLVVQANQKRLQKWAKHAPMNYLHKWHLVEAERARVFGNPAVVLFHYEQAIQLAQRHQYSSEAALAYELAGRFALQQNTVVGEAYIREARATYAHWGASAKVRHLEQCYPQITAAQVPVPDLRASMGGKMFTHISSSDALSGAALDLASILKAGQVITREIELPKLITTLVHLACENVGADMGLILFERDGTWHPFITHTDPPAPRLPESVLSYVARTRELLVLADAAEAPPFSYDPALASRRPRSLACLPLLNQGHITALLYLENTLLPNAFTPERIETVQLLAAQAAIALENARLYQQLADYSRTLEQQVEQRTAELVVARHVAEEANHLKSQFLANMSHELRTPLNAIINFTEFTLDEDYGPLSDSQRQFLERVCYNSEHLLGLINDILDLSKIESGKLDLRIEQAPLGPMLEGVMSTAIGLTADKGLALTLEAAKDLSLVWMDMQRVRQVLLNLISNAAKFTERGGITVQATEIGHGFVQIAVSDTGIGIPPEHQGLVFEEFRQVESELGRSYQGTGLGLPISKRLVELHGGSMWLKSTPGVGSIFAFTLPTSQPPDKRDQL